MTHDSPRKPGSTSERSTQSERGGSAAEEDLRSVRLIRKYAEMIDGVDLVAADVGDRLDLPPRDADVLIAEGWAVPDTEQRARLPRRTIAADHSRRARKKPGN